MALDEATFAAILAGKATGTCRAGCGTPLDAALVDDGAGNGIHPGCTLSKPTSTVSELSDVLIAYERNRPRSRQARIGPSELGTPCDARLIRKLSGAPNHRETSVAWAPLQGVAMHAELEKVTAFWNRLLGWERFAIEQRLKMSDLLGGTSDVYDHQAAMVIDWKLVGSTAINKLIGAQRRGLPPEDQVSVEYRVQAHLYGLGQQRAGQEVKWVRLVLLPRSANFLEAAEWTEQYRPDIAHAAVARHELLIRDAAELDLANHPDQITAVKTAPGDACRWCPYHQPSAPTTWMSCAGDTSAIRRFADGVL